MVTKVKGGPAFPHNRLGSDHDGMTLRDYFAARIAAGDAAASEGWSIDDPYSETARRLFLTRARLYYAIADAMLETRK